ncbi:DUF1800 domain-containing protein [Shewanella sp. WXL01]|uniref:DUF1800 domain-containing protein n=1 Tax=Shewanella sp. WXL01 TaxID=2709721 RepID=UPI001438504D|nr:DUF1800 domain-containing protein [Shewanella sp. WXL01]NKF51233.1 DUF1800 domain-containing protein [Shewanella sp. WXL01]
MSVHGVIAVNRFGYGAKPGELAKAISNPQGFLKQQLKQPEFNRVLPSASELMQKLYQQRQQAKMLESKKQESQKQQTQNKESATSPSNNNQTKKPPKVQQQAYRDFCQDSFKAAVKSDNSLSWRLLDFFSNHFSVTAQGPVMTALAPTLEREAIAPNLFGSFADMLDAVVHHPAMLVYLNNQQSFGVNSKIGKRKGKGLNENLAREILELHTLGVDGPYNQTDVIALAKGISGWSVSNKSKHSGRNGFFYRDAGHEPGSQQLVGKRFGQSGEAQGRAMLKHLALHPSTAKFVSYKLAKHFISDEPEQELVNALVARWQQTQGNLKQVVEALIEHPLAWQSERAKFITPREHLIFAHRVTAAPLPKTRNLIGLLNQLGQRPFKAGSPAGYGDTEGDWLSDKVMIDRITWSRMLAAKVSKLDVKQLIEQVWDEQLSQRSYLSITRAESRVDAITLLLMSPETLRR